MGRSALVAFVTSVVTTFAAFAALTVADRRGMLDFLHGGKGDVEVPSINGVSVEQARDLLRARDLLLTLQFERPDPDHPRRPDRRPDAAAGIAHAARDGDPGVTCRRARARS